MTEEKIIGIFASTILAILVGLVILALWGCPKYNVYSQQMEGEALLAHAEYSKKVQVQDALVALRALLRGGKT